MAVPSRRTVFAAQAILAALCFVALAFYVRYEIGESDKVAEAISQEQKIVRAIRTIHSADNHYPDTLDDVAPWLDKGRNAIVDPWGKRFMFAVEEDGRIRVWTTTPRGTLIQWPAK